MEQTYEFFMCDELEDDDDNNNTTNVNYDRLSSECCFTIQLKYIHSFKVRNLNSSTQTISIPWFSNQHSFLIPSQHLLTNAPSVLRDMFSNYSIPDGFAGELAFGVVDFANKCLIDHNVPIDEIDSITWSQKVKILVPMTLHVVGITRFSDICDFERVMKELYSEEYYNNYFKSYLNSDSKLVSGEIFDKVDFGMLRSNSNTSGILIDKCSICLEDYLLSIEGKEIVSTRCSHIYHKDCILGWLKQSQSCPLCRHDIL